MANEREREQEHEIRSAICRETKKNKKNGVLSMNSTAAMRQTAHRLSPCLTLRQQASQIVCWKA